MMTMNMKAYKPLIAAFLLAGSAITASSQSLEPFSPYAPVTPSVEAWSMSHYGGLTPSLNTGAMTFSLPICNYSDADFNIPVELQYQFNGFRPSENSGTVGYGWFLNCGGVITREVRGFPDEERSFVEESFEVTCGYYFTVKDGNSFVSYDELTFEQEYSMMPNTNRKYPIFEEDIKHMNPFTHVPTYTAVTLEKGVSGFQLSSLSNFHYDVNPDIFHFNFLGISGDFMLMPDGRVEVFNSNVPYGEISVEFNVSNDIRNSNVAPLSGFTITMSDGSIYKFGGTIPSVEYGATYNTENRSNTFLNLVPSAWRLIGITTPEGRSVEFDYSEEKQVYRNIYATYSPQSNELHFNSMEYSQHSYSCASVLQSVSVDGKRAIEFSYEGKALDEGSAEYYNESWFYHVRFDSGLREAGTALRLSAIRLLDSDGRTVDNADLFQSYAQSGTPKMFLESVSLMKGGRYSFGYNTSGVSFPKNDTKGTDHWGWWNGWDRSNSFNPRSPDCIDPSLNRYYQVKGPYKNPDLIRTLAGAMTTVTYPSGGTTEIGYEANTAQKGLEEEGWIIDLPPVVGGVRVSRMTDKVSSDAEGLVTTFSYQGGFLYRMPKYVFEVRLVYHHPAVDRGITCDNYTLKGFSNDCDYTVSRDNILDYRTVTTTGPDGSYSVSEFSNYETDADKYLEELICCQFRKRCILCGGDFFEAPTGYCPNIVMPVTDKKNMRGLMLSQTLYNAEGKPVRKETHSYASRSVNLKWIWGNNVDSFIRTPWACESPMKQSDTVTDYYPDGKGKTVTTTCSYNVKGQKTSESSFDGLDGTAVHFQYVHDTASTPQNSATAVEWGYDKQLSDAVKTRTVEGVTYIIAAEHYDYTNGGVKTLRPTAITSYVIDTPIPVDRNAGVKEMKVQLSRCSTRVSTFKYDGKGRLIRADLPGGAYIKYSWTSDGKYIASKSVNADDNMIKYEWRDMVGLSKMQDATGQTETYLYDTRNRLMQRTDTNGNPTEKYYYHLKNE